MGRRGKGEGRGGREGLGVRDFELSWPEVDRCSMVYEKRRSG